MWKFFGNWVNNEEICSSGNKCCVQKVGSFVSLMRNFTVMKTFSVEFYSSGNFKCKILEASRILSAEILEPMRILSEKFYSSKKFNNYSKSSFFNMQKFI
jgi:hypothetical protein